MLPFGVFAGILVMDQVTKHLVRTLMTVGESIPAEGFFRLVYVRNTGAAFGILEDGRPFLIAVSVIALSMVFWLLASRRIGFLNQPLGLVALGLVGGGIAGNLIDRVAFGYVTDFISAGIWPNFNIADSALVVGMILLGLLYLRSEQTDAR
jgi:signal peptidase II